MAIVFRLFLFLIFFETFSHGLEEDDQQDELLYSLDLSELADADLMFILETPQGEAQVKCHSRALESLNSSFFNGLLEEEKRRAQDKAFIEIPLKVNSAKTFKRVIFFLYRDLIQINPSNLSELIRLAHHLDIPKLGDKIVKHLQTTECSFLAEMDDKAVELLALRIREASGVKKIRIEEGRYWGSVAFDHFMDYLLLSKIAKDPRGLHKLVANAFSKDKRIQEVLNSPGFNRVQALDPALQRAKAKIVTRKQQEIERNAQSMAERIETEIGEELLKMRNKGRKWPIYVNVPLAQAEEMMRALGHILQGVTLRIDPVIQPYKLPGEMDKTYEFLCSDFHNDNNGCCQSCGTYFAWSVACLFQMTGLQCLQALTCGWFCCGGTDLAYGRSCGDIIYRAVVDDRTGRAIFYTIYDGGTCMANCCQGPTRTIRIDVN